MIADIARRGCLSRDDLKRVKPALAQRVFLFLETDGFARDHLTYTRGGVRFVEAVRQEPSLAGVVSGP